MFAVTMKMHKQRYGFQNTQSKISIPKHTIRIKKSFVPCLVEVVAGMTDMCTKMHKQRYAFQNTPSKTCVSKCTI
jgi:hypothetical protein